MSFALVGELIDALDGHKNLRCRPRVEMDSGKVLLSVEITPSEQADGFNAMDVSNLFTDLLLVHDVATMRALVHRYDIDKTSLEGLLRKREDKP